MASLKLAVKLWAASVLLGLLAIVAAAGSAGPGIAGGERAALGLLAFDGLLLIGGTLWLLRRLPADASAARWWVLVCFVLMQGALTIMLAFTGLVVLNR